MQERTTKARIIAATANLLQAQGYHGTGLNEIVRTSSAPKGSLYFHFPGGKEELAEEALQSAGDAYSRLIESAMDSGGDVSDAVCTVIGWLAASLRASEFSSGCPVATVALDVASSSERLRVACRDIFVEWRALIERRLAASGYDPARAAGLAMFVLASIEGALLFSRVERDTTPLETVGEQLKHILKR